MTGGRATRRYVVGHVSAMPPGSRRIVQAGNRSIGVFNVNGRYYGLRNACPHQGAPLCIGPVTGTTESDVPHEMRFTREGEIIRCPWHSWEFDITTGRSVFQPHAVRVKAFDVTVGEAGEQDVILETFEVLVEGDFVILHA
jgi:nitrite reductase (NADH) small subunit